MPWPRLEEKMRRWSEHMHMGVSEGWSEHMHMGVGETGSPHCCVPYVVCPMPCALCYHWCAR